MIMNKYLLFGILSSMLLVGTACEDFKFGNDFLDKPITTDITIDTVFNHKSMPIRYWRKLIILCRIFFQKVEDLHGQCWIA